MMNETKNVEEKKREWEKVLLCENPIPETPEFCDQSSTLWIHPGAFEMVDEKMRQKWTKEREKNHTP